MRSNGWSKIQSLFRDGTVLLLEKIRLGDSSFEIRTKGETNIGSLVTPDYNYFSFIDVYKIIKEESITIYMGGGSFGGDGFVYLMLKWAFFILNYLLLYKVQMLFIPRSWKL